MLFTAATRLTESEEINKQKNYIVASSDTSSETSRFRLQLYVVLDRIGGTTRPTSYAHSNRSLDVRRSKWTYVSPTD